MAVVRWDPFRTLIKWPLQWEDEDWSLPSSSIPSNLDVFETETQVVVRATLAGVDEKNVTITFEKGILTISAEETETESSDKKYYQKASRSYSYRVAVPGNVNTTVDPKAEIDKGIVEITFQKTPEEKPKQIAITTKK